MMRVFSVLLALAAALVLASAKTDLEQQAEKLIEDFRTSMPTGWEDIGIPALEPAVIKELPINVKVSPIDAHCLVSDVSVAGVSGFEFTRLQQIEGTNKLAVSVKLPDVTANGQYDLDGKVKIGFINIKLGGSKGPVHVTLKGLKGDATVDVQVNNDGTLNLANLKIDSWSYDTVTIKLENLLNGGIFGNTVNKLVNKLVPSFIKSNKNKINAMVETMGKQVINQYLDGVAGKLKPASLRLHASKAAPLTLTEDEWTVSAETQEILDQLAAGAISLAPKNFLALSDME